MNLRVESADGPMITVIMPVFNTAPYLSEALASIRDQTIDEIEIICINDASTDESHEILHRHALEDPRIRLIDLEQNQGLGFVRNLGLSQAQGKYTYFFDSDDILEREALQNLYTRAESGAFDAVLFNARPSVEIVADSDLLHRYERQYLRVHDYQQGLSGEELMSQMSERGEWKPSACLYLARKDLITSASLLFTEGVLHEDNGFTMRLMLAGNSMGYDSSAYFVRRVRDNSITTGSLTAEHIRGLLVASAEVLFAPEGLSASARTSLAVSVQAESLFLDAAQKYLKLPEGEKQIFLEWAPNVALQVFLRDRLLQHCIGAAVSESLEHCEKITAALTAENDAFRRSRVLRLVRKIRSFLPPYNR